MRTPLLPLPRAALPAAFVPMKLPAMVQTPGPAPATQFGSEAGMLNWMVSAAPAFAFASRIACRKLPAPLSFVFVTVKVAGPVMTARQAENSEVLPEGSLAVAVTNSPAEV